MFQHAEEGCQQESCHFCCFEAWCPRAVCGCFWRVDASSEASFWTWAASTQAPVVLSAAGLRDKVKTLPSCRGHKFLRSGTFDRVADLVLVGSLASDFDGPEVLYARLHGSRLVTPAWFQGCDKQEEVCFRSAMAHGKHMILWVRATFSNEFPDHMKVLQAGANHSPSMKGGRPCFEIQEGEMPASVRTPTLTHQLVGAAFQPARPERAKPPWTFQDLLRACTLVWETVDSRGESSSIQC